MKNRKPVPASPGSLKAQARRCPAPAPIVPKVHPPSQTRMRLPPITATVPKASSAYPGANAAPLGTSMHADGALTPLIDHAFTPKAALTASKSHAYISALTQDQSLLIQCVAENKRGRDFIVGDLHGCLAQLHMALHKVKFSPSSGDRLFSVGDLIDRGPQSFDCLKLILEPWFFYVRGNHEQMLLDFMGLELGASRGTAQDFIPNGGGWIHSLTLAQKELFYDVLAPRLVRAPLLLKVGYGGLQPFNVVHSELMSADGALIGTKDLTTKTVVDRRVSMTWGRRLVKLAAKEITNGYQAVGGVWLTANSVNPRLHPTYVGHTVVTNPVMHRSHIFIDGGAYKESGETKLVVREHAPFVAALNMHFMPKGTARLQLAEASGSRLGRRGLWDLEQERRMALEELNQDLARRELSGS